MKKGLLISLLLVSVGILAQEKSGSLAVSARNIPFDQNWLFVKDSMPNAEQQGFNDSKWRKLDLPHDWSIEDLPNQTPDSIIGPFHKGSPGWTYTGFTVGGTGWYRKKFITLKEEQSKQVTIHFDGVYMNSDVWLNGHHLGDHPNGYTPFYYDLTPYLKVAGQENVLAVRVRNEGRNSRWYSGSGIYRHVWLTVKDVVHIAPWGIFITTPDVSANSATVKIKASIGNKQASGNVVHLVTTILSPQGKIVGRSRQIITLDGNATKICEQSIAVNNPALWSIETPHLYKTITEIRKGAQTIDRVETPFGIRSIKIDAVNGLTINGKKVLLKGGCVHHDNGPLGAMAIDRAEERKVEILKKNGFNAIRCSHNPPSTQFLNVCDRLGMLVIDEAFDMWTKAKRPDDYHQYFKDWWKQDIDAILLRDRNHPSIIFWSIGNEIPERVDSIGLAIRKMLKQRVREIDPTRMVTEAIHRTPAWDKKTPAAFEDLDVAGYNYAIERYEPDHQKFSDRVLMGTESYPMEALENWSLAEKHPYLLGDFVWTAIDYLGEASIGNSSINSKKDFNPNLGWPWFNGYSGDIDLIGNKKAPSYYRDVVWRNKPIAMAVHAPIPDGMVENVSRWGWPDESQSWTWPGCEEQSLQVRIFSRASIVRLLLNGKIIAEQKIADSSITAVFQLPYQPGTLKAVNIVNGKEADAVKFKTAGAAKRIRLIADRTNIHASRNDLSYVMVEITDEKGQVVPDDEIPIQFSISGAGEIAGVGNASPTDMASFKQPKRKTVNGKCLAIVRPTGNIGMITLKATAYGLRPAQIVIHTR
ncbi:MAG: glycoside hydrolase family 2 TIM barrel-domain containing protein [Ferruginibacter sp.]